MGEWTFKDLVAHLTAWQRHELAPLEQALRGERKSRSATCALVSPAATRRNTSTSRTERPAG